jgi:hypothetical protein
MISLPASGQPVAVINVVSSSSQDTSRQMGTSPVSIIRWANNYHDEDHETASANERCCGMYTIRSRTISLSSADSTSTTCSSAIERALPVVDTKRVRFAAPLKKKVFTTGPQHQSRVILSREECAQCWYTYQDRQKFKQERLAMEQYYQSPSCQFFVQGTIDKAYLAVVDDVDTVFDDAPHLAQVQHEDTAILSLPHKNKTRSVSQDRSALMALEMWTLNGFGRGLEQSISKVHGTILKHNAVVRLQVIEKSRGNRKTRSSRQIAAWYHDATKDSAYIAHLMGLADASAAQLVYGK